MVAAKFGLKSIELIIMMEIWTPCEATAIANMQPTSKALQPAYDAAIMKMASAKEAEIKRGMKGRVFLARKYEFLTHSHEGFSGAGHGQSIGRD